MELYSKSEAGQWLLKLLVRDDVFARLILDSDEISEVVPEIDAMIGFDQCNPHHPYDLWTHTANCVASVAPDPVLRLTMLMHDTGKPSTFYFTEDEVGHFNRHEAKGEKIVRERLAELRVNKDTIETIAILVRNHDKGISENELERWINEIGEERLRMLLDIKEADARSHGEKYKIKQLSRVAELRRLLSEIK